MMLEITPKIYNTTNTRIALYKIMTKLGIPFHYVPYAEFLTVYISEEDAVLFTLKGGSEMVESYLSNVGWSS